jgi:hypothetical protein
MARHTIANCASDNRALSVRRPMEVAVFELPGHSYEPDCMAIEDSTIFAKSVSDLVSKALYFARSGDKVPLTAHSREPSSLQRRIKNDLFQEDRRFMSGFVSRIDLSGARKDGDDNRDHPSLPLFARKVGNIPSQTTLCAINEGAVAAVPQFRVRSSVSSPASRAQPRYQRTAHRLSSGAVYRP